MQMDTGDRGQRGGRGGRRGGSHTNYRGRSGGAYPSGYQDGYHNPPAYVPVSGWQGGWTPSGSKRSFPSHSRGRHGSSPGRGGGRGPGNSPHQVPEDMEFVRLMSGHTRKVTSMALDPQSGQLFTGSHDGNVRVWNLQSGDCSAVLPAHGDVDSLLFESGFLFAGVKTASGPGQVRVWAPGGGESVLEGHQGQVLALAAANGALFSAGQDCTIRVWTPTPAPPPGSPTFHCSAVLSQEMGGHAQPVNCLCISGPWLFSADFGGTIKVWSLAQGSLTQTLERAHSDARVPAITHLLVCDSHLVSAALDGRLKVWTPVEGGAGAGAVVAETPAFVWPELEAVQQGKRGGRGAPPPLAGILAVQGVTDPEGKALLAVSFNGEKCVRLFEWPTFNDRGTFAEVINARGMAAIGQFFVAGDERGKVKVWRYKAAAQGRAADASVGAF